MPITTSDNDIKERLSLAYVAAVAARAGCQVTEPAKDKQSIDVNVRPISGRKVSIDLQLKATSADCIDAEDLVFALPVKNYDDLRDPHCTAPHYLVVVLLHPDDRAWLEGNEERLLLRKCAYWLSLLSMPATTNKETVTIRLPRNQMFDVAALRWMMQHAFDSRQLSGRGAS